MKNNYVLSKITLISIFMFFLIIPTLSFSDVIDDLQPGHWIEIADSNMSSEYTTPSPPGSSGQQSVMKAWSGGAYDTKRDRLIVWGGGHSDYGGNEMYAFNINTMTWQQITQPSTPAPTCENYMPDGQPGISHTYNQLQYSYITDSFIRTSGAFWGSACSAAMHNLQVVTTDIYSFNTNSWIKATLHPSAGLSTGRISAIDHATGHIWVHGTYGGGKLIKYDPENDEWSVHSPTKYLEIDSTAAIDPIRRIMVAVGGYNGNRQILVWDISKKFGTALIPTTSGDTILEYSNAIGFEFDPVINKFVGWLDGSSVYTLDPETWTWTKIVAAQTNIVVPAREVNGTYGRFRYIPAKNAYILVNKTTENVYFYKLNNNPPIQEPNVPNTPSTEVNNL